MSRPLWFCLGLALASLIRLPLVGRLIGVFLGLTWLLIIPVRRAVVWHNLKLFLGDSSLFRRLTFLTGIALSQGHRLSEMLVHWHYPKALKMEYSGWHHLENAAKSGKGLIIVCAHVGPWEAYLSEVSRRLGGMSVPIKPPSSKGLAAYVQDRREGFLVQALPMTGSSKAMLRVLKGGGVVALAMDQRPKKHKETVEVNFLGQPSQISRAAEVLARRSGSEVVIITGFSERGVVNVRIAALSSMERGAKEAQKQWTRDVIGLLEAGIVLAPKQWLWLHRRWL